MKTALQKTPIPKMHSFVVKYLKQPHFDPTWHFHSEYQIFLVIKGKGIRLVGDSIRPFKEGDVVFIGPNLPHLWKSDDEGFKLSKKSWVEGIVIYFPQNFISTSLLEKEEFIKLKQLFKMSLRGLEFTGHTSTNIKRMMKGLLKIEGFTSVLKLVEILNCLCNSQDLKLLANSGYTNILKEDNTQIMNKVQSYIMKNFRKKIYINELAAIANLTPTSFSRYFKIHANKTFSEFLREIRIGHACKLLIEGQKNINNICYECGFQTISNFNKQFKENVNKTPTEYKMEFEIK